MGAIFLSYAREDRGCAEALARVLEGAGHSVWWDRRIGGGEEFGAEIEAELDKSDVVLVAWSKESVRSRWVRDEAAVGGDRGILVPLSIDGSRPPMGFRQFHTLDLTGWKGGARDPRTAELLQSVERRLKGKDTSAPAAATTRKRWISLPTGKPLWAMVAALVLVIAAGLAVFLLYSRASLSGPPPKPTIALLPFTTASPDVELRSIAAQARDSVSHTLSQSGMPVRLFDAVPQDRRSAGDFLLSGELSRNADKIVATVRLVEAIYGVTVATQRIAASREQISDLPERIGAHTAALFGGWELLVLDRRHPLDPALMAELLAESDDELQGYQVAKRVAAKAPDASQTQIALAFQTAFALGQLPRDERPEAVADARRAAERAIAMAPNFGDAYSPWCLLHSETLLVQCEDRLRAGRRIDPDAPWLNTFLSHLLRNVGRIDEAMALARLSYTHDVYLPQKIAWMLKTLEFAKDSDATHELYQQGARWWPGFKPMFFRNRLFGLVERGDFVAMQRLEQEVGPDALPPDYTKGSAIVAALKARSQPALRRACPMGEDFFINIRCMIAFAMLGDEDGAYAIADKLYPRRVGRRPAETERIWLEDPDAAPLEFITSPAAAPMRRDPRYLALAQRTGLLAYWRAGRLPDFCRKHPEPICAQLLKRR